MGILLYIIASLLWLPLTFLNWVTVAYKYGLSNDYFMQTAIDIDKFGNRNFRTLLNYALIKENGYKFGDVRETISSALGKNKIADTLNKTGIVLCKILDFLDENHCIKSINNFKNK